MCLISFETVVEILFALKLLLTRQKQLATGLLEKAVKTVNFKIRLAASCSIRPVVPFAASQYRLLSFPLISSN